MSFCIWLISLGIIFKVFFHNVYMKASFIFYGRAISWCMYCILFSDSSVAGHWVVCLLWVIHWTLMYSYLFESVFVLFNCRAFKSTYSVYSSFAGYMFNKYFLSFCGLSSFFKRQKFLISLMSGLFFLLLPIF
jgi:hypothetical protein